MPTECPHENRHPAPRLPPGAWVCHDCGTVGRPRGRPPRKPESERRVLRYEIRLSAEERERYQRAADDEGEELADWIRGAADERAATASPAR